MQVSSMSARGRNWGDAVLDNETLQFHAEGRPLFNVALPDVVQVCAVLQGRLLQASRRRAPDLQVALNSHARKRMAAGISSIWAGGALAGALLLDGGALQPVPWGRVPAARVVPRGLPSAARGGRMRPRQ